MPRDFGHIEKYHTESGYTTGIRGTQFGFGALFMLASWGLILSAIALPYDSSYSTSIEVNLYWFLLCSGIISGIVSLLWIIEHTFDVRFMHLIMFTLYILAFLLLVATAGIATYVWNFAVSYAICTRGLVCMGPACNVNITGWLAPMLDVNNGAATPRCTTVMWLCWINVLFALLACLFSGLLARQKWCELHPDDAMCKKPKFEQRIHDMAARKGEDPKWVGHFRDDY
jgi:hypothetical protein